MIFPSVFCNYTTTYTSQNGIETGKAPRFGSRIFWRMGLTSKRVFTAMLMIPTALGFGYQVQGRRGVSKAILSMLSVSPYISMLYIDISY